MKIIPVALLVFLMLVPLPVAAQGGEQPVLPADLEPITTNNIHRLEQLAVFDFGSVDNLNWSPDGDTLTIEGTNGMWAYAMADLSRPTLLPNAAIEAWMQEPHGWLTERDLAPYRDLTDAVSVGVALNREKNLLAEIDERELRVWDVQRGQVRVSIPVDGAAYMNGLAFSADGQRLAAGFWETSNEGEGTTILVWDARDGRQIAALRGGHQRAILQIVLDPTGRWLASVDIDLTLNVWNLATGERLASLSNHAYGSPSLVFSPDGATLASAGGMSDVILWDVLTGRQTRVLRPDPRIMIHDLRFIDGQTLFATGVCGPLQGWNMATGDQPVDLGCKASHRDGLTAFSADGRWIVGVEEHSPTIDVWEVATDTRVAELVGHEGWVNATAFSPDGTRLASGGTDGKIRLWDTATWETVTVMAPQEGTVWALAFSPDGRFLISASGDGTARLWYVGPRNWDTIAGTSIGILYTNQQQSWPFVFNPDGRLLLTTACQNLTMNNQDRSCSLVFWDVASVQSIRVLQMDEEWITAAFNPENTLLAIGTTWGGIELWGVPGS